MRVFSILYYTNNYEKFKTFRRDCIGPLSSAYNAGTQAKILDSFVVENEQIKPKFTCLRELTDFLEDYNGNLSDLIVIMDCDLLQEDAQKSIQAILIEYLEIKFLFDADPRWVIFNKDEIKKLIREQRVDICKSCLKELEHCTEKGQLTDDFIGMISVESPGLETWDFLRTLFKRCTDYKARVREIRRQLIRRIAFEYVNFDYLLLPERDGDFILSLVHAQDNLFDSSNLRYCIKQWKYAELDVHSRNYLLIQNSRRDNLAICVEEEKGQNRFNSYCLFACGYRVLPVTSATELLKVNQHAEELSPKLIIRDYDLQFFDSSSVKYEQAGDSNGAIKAIRGFRDNLDGKWETHVFESPCWSSFYKGYSEKTEAIIPLSIPENATASINDADDICPVYFVSKGTGDISILPPGNFIGKKKQEGKDRTIRLSHYYTSIKEGKLCLPGLLKPVSGIYEPFRCIPEIRKQLKSIKTSATEYLDTSREGHSHGTSLDIYSTVNSLISRAEKYFNLGKVVHSAILSNEAIEYLNGFHEALILKAYRILAVSENAIAMDTVGGDEVVLKDDTIFRIGKIEHEIDKVLRRSPEERIGNEDRREFKYNILNQIYSECRKCCKDKERFSAEDCFISAMAHENEGFTPNDIIHEFKVILKRIQKSWTSKRNELNY